MTNQLSCEHTDLINGTNFSTLAHKYEVDDDDEKFYQDR